MLQLTLERVQRNFDLWYGGVPRLVLEDPAMFTDDSRDSGSAIAAIKFTSFEEVRLIAVFAEGVMSQVQNADLQLVGM